VPAVCTALVLCIEAASADWVTGTVATGEGPQALAVNPVTNKIYVTNYEANSMTVIDGTTNDTATVAVGSYPVAVSVNPVTNRTYVASYTGDSVAVIDGATNDIARVPTGAGPRALAVNPATNKVYAANYYGDNVTVIDGATNDTTTVIAGHHPRAVAVDPVSNRIYVANYDSGSVTVIDGATNATATVSAGRVPFAVAANPAANKIYVINRYGDNVTVIDGATNGTNKVVAGANPYALTVNPVTGKVYVANSGSGDVTVIDGATNATTTVAAGAMPFGIAVNPVTNRVYVANSGSDNVTVVTDVTTYDTKVRATYDRLPGDTTSCGRVALGGRGVNRCAPGRATVLGVLNHIGSAQLPGSWAQVTSGGGTDSISWSHNWGDDSLLPGENFVCCAPLEDQAATTNNLGLGTPFAGNLEVYPVYRVGFAAGIEETPSAELRTTKVATIIRGMLSLPRDMTGAGHDPNARHWGSCPKPYTRPDLLDMAGREVMALHAGANDVSGFAPGVYFVHSSIVNRQSIMTKVIVTR